MVQLGASIQSLVAEEFARPPANPRERLLSAVEELVTSYRLDAVELFLDGIFLFPGIVDAALLSDIARLQQRIGVTLTAHLPYVWVDLSSGNEPMRAAAVEAIVTAVTMTEALDITSYVLHATGPFGNEVAPRVVHPEQSFWMQLMLAAIDRSLADLRRRLPDAPLAVETLEGFPFEWQAPLVESHGFAVCCDVAHLVVRGVDPVPFVEQWLPRIRSFHIHGVREQRLTMQLTRRSDHHALGGPGELVDTPQLLSLLSSRGFTGPVIIENTSAADLAQSVATLRRAAGREA